MQLKTLQIVWHGKEPVLSVDFQPNSHTLASGGQDGEVKHWEVVAEEDGSPGVRFLSSYPVNSKAVNCVRFSPAGDMLASAGDKGEVLLWRFAAFAAGAQPPPQPQQQRGQLDGVDAGACAPASSGSSAAAAASGMWRQVGLLRGHCDDVLDLAWAPDGSALLSGGIENNCILWDVEGRKSLKWLQDHGHYVQGVAWDPLGRYIVSQSADRTARVYAVKPPPVAADGGVKRATVATAAPSVVTSAGLARDGFYAAATLSKGPLLLLGPQHQQSEIATGGAEGEMAPRGGGASDAVAADVQQLQLGQEGAAAAPGAGGGVAKQPLFCDDSLPTFFRRLAWSPDGAFLAMPAGMYRAGISAPVTSTTHIFSRGDWSGPALSLPCLSKGALVVRFCPRLFRAPQPPESTAAAGGPAASLLTYRIIMAVASVDSVVLYDMQALEPLAVLGGIHFAAVTDLAWSDDGRYLVVASRDGYCTVCSFEEGELGEPVPLEELPAGVAAAVSRAAARRYQERTAAAAALRAAAAVTTAPVAAPPESVMDEHLEAPALVAASDAMAAAAPEARISAAGPRRIQPIPVVCVGSDADVTRAGPGGAAGGDTATVASAKRPADGELSMPGSAGGRPKPKRIQPVPLSATALATALPAAAAAAATGGSCPGRSSSGGLAISSAPPAAAPMVTATVTAAAASPGRRRIVPTRVDGPSGGIGHAGAVVAAVAPAAAGGRSPLLAATPGPVHDIAMAPARTPVLAGVCGADGMVVPGVAAPGSAVKMPTPQVLVFGTPPSSAPRQHGSECPGTGAPVLEHRHLAAAACQPLQSQPKPKRVTPVPVDRGNQNILGGDTLPAALPPPPPTVMAPAQPPNQHGLVTRAGEGPPQPKPAQTECQNAQVPVTCATMGHGTAVVSSDVGAGGDSDAAAAAQDGGPSPGSGAVAGGADGGGGGGGPRFSVAQLAAIRGAAAARKAAEGAL
ncbi:hypothetical protein Vafri_10487 [Volvox africanus]|uniref:CAF1B/HIR1 beta-propeller domain-containing protein n=1 Tax=Volvox africanus TaxID=51714 RepID=A0A8J4F3C8_9CHLO|nr:hypothetical protein Vafri_10487 [Volvox africanus]